MELWEYALAAPFPDSTFKKVLLIGYLELLLEHQSGMAMLIREHHPGAGMALMRSVFEIMCRGLWTMAKASERDAERILGDKFAFPNMRTMVEQIDASYGSGSVFTKMTKNNWKSLNSFAHSGSMQLRRRMLSTSIENNYPEDELQRAINFVSG